MKFYAKMKATNSPWLGEVPSHWELSRLRYEAVINGGQVDPREAPWSGMTLIAPNHIESNTGRIISAETAEEQGADSGKYLVERGQLVYSKIRPALNKAAIAETRALCSADMYAMSFADRVEPRFALYQFLARPFHTFATIISMRVKMPKVNREELADAPWLVPPLDEQRVIAGYLDRETARIDMLIDEQQRLIEMLLERRQALIERSMLDSSDAPIRLSRIASSRSGDVPPPLEEDGQYVVWGAGRVVGHTSQVNAQAGDLLVGRVGQGSVGKVRRLTENAWATDNTIVLRLDLSAADPRYIEHGLRLIPRFELVGGGAMPLVTAERLVAQTVPFTTLTTQQRIADHLDQQTAKIDLLITETERFIELSKERRAALITAAVTGQIDVRVMA